MDVSRPGVTDVVCCIIVILILLLLLVTMVCVVIFAMLARQRVLAGYFAIQIMSVIRGLLNYKARPTLESLSFLPPHSFQMEEEQYYYCGVIILYRTCFIASASNTSKATK